MAVEEAFDRAKHHFHLPQMPCFLVRPRLQPLTFIDFLIFTILAAALATILPDNVIGPVCCVAIVV